MLSIEPKIIKTDLKFGLKTLYNSVLEFNETGKTPELYCRPEHAIEVLNFYDRMEDKWKSVKTVYIALVAYVLK